MVERYQQQSEASLPPPNPKRGRTGSPFVKGNKLSPGRPKGALSKTTALAKDYILTSLDRLGYLKPIWSYKEGKLVERGRGAKKRWIQLPDVKDRIIGWEPTGEGENAENAIGFLMWLACNNSSAYAALIGRVLPLQVTSNLTLDATVTTKFSDVDISRMTLAEKQAAFREMIGMTKSLPAPDNKEASSGFRMIEGKATRNNEG